MPLYTMGLQEGRSNLAALASRAHAGQPSLLTRHGKPYAAIVSAEMLLKARPRQRFLELRGSGKGLWGPAPAGGIAAERDEW